MDEGRDEGEEDARDRPHEPRLLPGIPAEAPHEEDRNRQQPVRARDTRDERVRLLLLVRDQLELALAEQLRERAAAHGPVQDQRDANGHADEDAHRAAVAEPHPVERGGRGHAEDDDDDAADELRHERRLPRAHPATQLLLVGFFELHAP
ncbi:hypothetical protein [Gulosibacter sediminis]|uniref:hypothetical protein n=1 Tax=Gulosibacter sediminis TaxID=1729695 RepID=UPI001868CC6D|nr:hypothetical protein [Gulosibacter sediminis]